MRTNKLILGTVQMGLPYGINNDEGKIKSDKAFEILNKAYESGIKFLDTAEAYGNVHQLIGDFHAFNPEKKFNVITKVPPTEKITQIERKVENYLNVMKISQFEGFMFHSFQSYINNHDIIPKLVLFKKEGIIKQLGVSIYTNQELEDLLDNENINLIQIPFNVLDNLSIRGKLMKEANNKGKTIHTRSAFLQGLIFKNPLDKHPVVKALKQQLIDIHKISDDEGLPIASLALAYCMQQPFIDQVLIGVDSIEQLELNLAAINVELPEKTVQLISQISIENKSFLNPSLWKNLETNN